jgi:hypothetical protein
MAWVRVAGEVKGFNPECTEKTGEKSEKGRGVYPRGAAGAEKSLGRATTEAKRAVKLARAVQSVEMLRYERV